VIGLDTLVVAGSGEANSLHPELFEARARATVRYADPAAWITAAAVANAILNVRGKLGASLHEVGMIVVSDQGPAFTMAEVNAATSNGFSSPLRYAASSPGSLAGVACIALGFRGPTLNFTMLPDDGVPVALQLCAGWLSRRAAQYVVLATFRAADLTIGSSRAVLLARPEPAVGFGNSLTQSVADWLVQSGDQIDAIHE
jgi:hypothetical protein